MWWFKRQQVSFRYEQKYTRVLGMTHRPMADVGFWAEPDKDWFLVRMLVDTGADYTLLPMFWSRLLGIDLAHAHQEKTVGLGGVESVFFVPDLAIKIGPFTRQIPVGFAQSDNVPPLLGRHACLETFTTTFDTTKKITFSAK